MDSKSMRQNLEGLQEAFQHLERRLTAVERSLKAFYPEGIPETEAAEATPDAVPIPEQREADDVNLEVTVGELWVGQAGVVALLVGVAFFITYPFAGFPAALQVLVGYLAVGGVFLVSRQWQASYPAISRTLFAGVPRGGKTPRSAPRILPLPPRR